MSPGSHRRVRSPSGGGRRSIGVDQPDVADIEASSFRSGTGAASDEVQLVTVTLGDGVRLQLVRKTFQALESGPHAEASGLSNHWAYWRRELTAYESGAVPQGSGLRAPRLLGIVDDTLYIEYAGEEQPASEEAALQLGRWHDRDQIDLDRSWLADDQLAQRLAATDLDWSTVEVDKRLPAIWAQRRDYMSRLAGLPEGIAHGDFSTGNLRSGETGVIVLDWATLGRSPVGFDLAHLASSTQNDSLLPIYLEGLTRDSILMTSNSVIG